MIPREFCRLLTAFITASRPRWRLVIAALLTLLAVAGVTQVMAAPPDVEMWRLDCGEFRNFDMEALSDVFAYPGKKKNLTNSCYLIRHEKQFMLWDAGFSLSTVTSEYGKSRRLGMNQTIASQLQTINVKPEQISIIGLSHWHWDHTGQAADFPNGRLLMGKSD
ncbi:MBL fold metallo-hydrolase [Bradyrhizobium sp. PMVTL-01]|uniref:MBL fold metallo-hydrolase n=1 Tax=Bradyrhizobium sp. PMVTL-01 TaxID=3434999 RepID=UPI003F7156C7